jgi:hypothetical protein
MSFYQIRLDLKRSNLKRIIQLSMERGRKIALLQFWVCELARANCKCAICAVGFQHDTQLVYNNTNLPLFLFPISIISPVFKETIVHSINQNLGN